MRKLTVLLFVSLGLLTSTHSMEDTSQPLKILNSSNYSFEIIVNYNISQLDNITETPPPCTWFLGPILPNYISSKIEIKSPKRFGLVTIKESGSPIFSNYMDLTSEIICQSLGKTYVYSYRHDSQKDQIPDWLYSSLKITPFNFEKYVQDIYTKWESLTEEQKANPLDNGIPSCLHCFDRDPKMSAPDFLTHCLSESMKLAAIDRFFNENPQHQITEEQIAAAERYLVEKKVAIYPHQ